MKIFKKINMALWLTVGVALSMPYYLHAKTQYYRLVWDSDPTHSAVIGFSPDGQSHSPYVRFGYGTDESVWERKAVDMSQAFDGLQSYFVRLTGLQPNQAVYYRVCDDDGCGDWFWFQTAPEDKSLFVFIAGGDTRTGWRTRRAGNDLIAKIRPLFVMHGGDFTNQNNHDELVQFFLDWERSYSNDTIDGKAYKRIYPLLPTHGNHEDGNYRTLCQVFGMDSNQNGSCEIEDAYGALDISPLLRVYTLNSQFKNSGMSSHARAQNDWLESDLDSHGKHVVWRVAQYHKPMYPHYSGKHDNEILFDWWAQLFYDYAVNLIVESDTHICSHP